MATISGTPPPRVTAQPTTARPATTPAKPASSGPVDSFQTAPAKTTSSAAATGADKPAATKADFDAGIAVLDKLGGNSDASTLKDLLSRNNLDGPDVQKMADALNHLASNPPSGLSQDDFNKINDAASYKIIDKAIMDGIMRQLKQALSKNPFKRT
jgi:hypothetical protein